MRTDDFIWLAVGAALASLRTRVGESVQVELELAIDAHLVELNLAIDAHLVKLGLAVDSHLVELGLAIDSHLVELGLAIDSHLVKLSRFTQFGFGAPAVHGLPANSLIQC
ncbi:hypothetical protein [Burkholderia sp. Ac-20392]|uniref:hypothetical protein n=1 Tax=Burkholderia sp. Ac-20392 TaxID=2703905 RepID=UPI00197CE4C9|nr:hypothetical protein [Burkholderia sp. Ac-20392]MBN3796305.1 hypothetical protein [Burkholderia sp. Ac-20392]